MTVAELRKVLAEIAAWSVGDPEVAHREADKALLAYIRDSTVTREFNRIEKWYA